MKENLSEDPNHGEQQGNDRQHSADFNKNKKSEAESYQKTDPFKSFLLNILTVDNRRSMTPSHQGVDISELSDGEYM